MPLILSGNVASAIGGGYEVANSCRFNDGDSAYMHKTPASDGNRRTWTISFWIKRGVLSGYHKAFSFFDDANNNTQFSFEDSNIIRLLNMTSGSVDLDLRTNQLFRDPSAWYHIVVAVDSTQSTASNRVKIFCNGSQITSFSTETYFNQNTDTFANFDGAAMNIASKDGSNYFVDGYMAEVVMIDGSQLTPTSFGEFDEDSPTIWKPIDVSGLTFGTNGFYLDFEDSSNLGNDANGGTDLTEVNLAATDQATDSPTNNFCTLNPLATGSYNTLSEGNLMTTGNTASDSGLATTTIPFAFGGKWYWEMKIIDGNLNSNSGYPVCGIFDDWESVSDADLNGAGGGALALDVQVQFGAGAGQTLVKPGTDLSITAPADDDIIMFAIDRDNNKFYMGNNGTWYNSGDPTTGATGTGSLMDLTANTMTMFGIHEYNGSDSSVNFGNPTYANSSSAADANGYGDFEYAPPSGYYALCTKNLAEYG